MKIEKLKVEKSKLDINLKFYYLLKQLVKAKLSEKQVSQFLEVISLFEGGGLEPLTEKLQKLIEGFSGDNKKDALYSIIATFERSVDIELFVFSLRLYMIKDLLLQEAKITDCVNSLNLEKLDPLSTEYDNISVYRPYSTRVNGALLALLFFSRLEAGDSNFMSADSCDFVNTLSVTAIKLRKKGVEPNQIFMLLFSESINQSIISDSGVNYEDRILSVLTKIGIPGNTISKTHDKNDASTEFDFFFEMNGRTYGIGAKRTLRERYKQFIKTAQMSKIDVMIEITLGLDLNEEKARTISLHGVYLFVADEIYQSRTYLHKMDRIYSVKELSLKLLKGLE